MSFEPSRYPDIQTLRIPEFGVTQSLNVAVAASVACFEWVRQHQRMGEGARAAG